MKVVARGFEPYDEDDARRHIPQEFFTCCECGARLQVEFGLPFDPEDYGDTVFGKPVVCIECGYPGQGHESVIEQPRG